MGKEIPSLQVGSISAGGDDEDLAEMTWVSQKRLAEKVLGIFLLICNPKNESQFPSQCLVNVNVLI